MGRTKRGTLCYKIDFFWHFWIELFHITEVPVGYMGTKYDSKKDYGTILKAFEKPIPYGNIYFLVRPPPPRGRVKGFWEVVLTNWRKSFQRGYKLSIFAPWLTFFGSKITFWLSRVKYCTMMKNHRNRVQNTFFGSKSVKRCQNWRKTVQKPVFEVRIKKKRNFLFFF